MELSRGITNKPEENRIEGRHCSCLSGKVRISSSVELNFLHLNAKLSRVIYQLLPDNSCPIIQQISDCASQFGNALDGIGTHVCATYFSTFQLWIIFLCRKPPVKQLFLSPSRLTFRFSLVHRLNSCWMLVDTTRK